jgi:UDP-glucose 4-epimerase
MSQKPICLVTGAAGFIAHNLIKRLLFSGWKVIGLDNFLLGSKENILELSQYPEFFFYDVDLSLDNVLEKLLQDVEDVLGVSDIWHLCANSDIKAGSASPNVDFKHTFSTTFNILGVAKAVSCKNFYFASSSAIYGDHGEHPLDETLTVPRPISNYGAMKLASEALISAYSESSNCRCVIFRFANVIGLPATHGVIHDFFKKLMSNGTKLNVLGNGEQKKIYLHVDDLIDGMIFLQESNAEGYDIFNIGPSESLGVTVKEIANEVVAQVSPEAEICYGLSDRGWIGDIPRFNFSTSKLKNLGWVARYTGQESVSKTISELKKQWISRKL